MATIGISITKEVAFRDSVQPFSNQYYYDNGIGSMPDEAAAEALLDQLVVIEKTFHATTVTFEYGRVWSQVGVEALNEMLKQKALSGTGSATSDVSMDRERAFLFRIRADNDSRGNPVYLRKWYHTCGIFPGATTVGSAIASNTSGFSDTQRAAMANNVNAIRTLTTGGVTFTLCAKSGRDFDTGGQFTCHKYLEHHQLGDQWRSV